MKKMSRSKVLMIFTIMSGFSKSYKDINPLISMGIEREKILASKKDIERARRKTMNFFKSIPDLSKNNSDGSDNINDNETAVLLFLNHMVDMLKTQRGSKMFYLADIQKKIKEKILLFENDDIDINSGGVFKSETLIGLLSV